MVCIFESIIVSTMKNNARADLESRHFVASAPVVRLEGDDDDDDDGSYDYAPAA